MFMLLLAIMYHPLLEPAWSNPGPFPREIFFYPEASYAIPMKKIREQAEYYRVMSDPVIRENIALLLKNAGTPDVYPVLESLLEQEENPSLQANLLNSMLIIALQEKIKPEKTSYLKKLLTHPSGAVRAKAAELLILSGEDSKFIVDMLEKETTSFVPEIVFNRLNASAKTLPSASLEKLAASGNLHLRIHALKHIAKNDLKAESNPLLSLPESAGVSEKTALAFGLGFNSANPYKLLKKFAEEKDARVRFAAAALRPGTSERTDILRKLLDDSSELVRARAAESLEKASSSPDLIDDLAKHLTDPDHLVRMKTGKTLAVLSGKTLRESVTSTISDKRAYLPLLMVFHASKNPDYAQSAAQIVEASLPDAQDVVIAGLDTLAVLKNQKTAQTVLRCADSPHEKIREAAALALREFPCAATTEALKKLTKDEKEKSAIAALESIRVLKDPAFVPELTEALGNFNNSSIFRAVACRAFSVIPDTLTASAIAKLNILILTTCIRVPEAPPIYEDTIGRTSALYLMYLSSKAGVAAADSAYKAACKRLENPTSKEKENGFDNSGLMEFYRQIKLLEQGREITKIPIPFQSMEPDYMIEPWVPLVKE